MTARRNGEGWFSTLFIRGNVRFHLKNIMGFGKLRHVCRIIFSFKTIGESLAHFSLHVLYLRTKAGAGCEAERGGRGMSEAKEKEISPPTPSQ